MPDDRTWVDMLSLEDFQTTLAARLRDVESILTRLVTELRERTPPLGTFIDGTATAAEYADLRAQHVDRIGRLHRAVLAAQLATASIIATYHTAEARARADAADIADRLGKAVAALDRGHADA